MMAMSSEITPRRKKSGSLNVQECSAFEKKAKSLTRSFERLTRSLTRSNSTADIEYVMHNAVLRDDPDTLKKVLRNEKLRDLDRYIPAGTTALHQACSLGSLECVELLVEAGANIYLKTKNNAACTPLQVAVRNAHYEVAEYLISKGAQDQEIKDGT